MTCLLCKDEGKILSFYERPGGLPGNRYIPCPLCDANKKIKDLEKKLETETACKEFEEGSYWLVNDIAYLWRDVYRRLRDHVRKQKDHEKGKWGGKLGEQSVRAVKHLDLIERRDKAVKKLIGLGELPEDWLE